MQRTVTTPADLSLDALEDLKRWLGISRAQEDALLTDLLIAGVAMCEAFTGQTPLEQIVEERIAPRAGRYALSSRPVKAMVSAQRIPDVGSLAALEEGDFEFELDAAHSACITLNRSLDAQAVAVTLRVGLAADWGALAGPLKQGIIRLAAFHYRERDTAKPMAPPASVAALWRPWRIARLT